MIWAEKFACPSIPVINLVCLKSCRVQLALITCGLRAIETKIYPDKVKIKFSERAYNYVELKEKDNKVLR